MSISRKKRDARRQKYTHQYKEKLKIELRSGYLEMAALNLELAEEGLNVDDE